MKSALKFLALLWFLLIVLYLSGGKATYLFRGCFLVTIALCWIFRRENLFDKIWITLERKISWRGFWFVFVLHVFCVFAVNWLLVKSFAVPMWDYAQYLQAVFYLAESGRATVTLLADSLRDYADVHRTWSMYILGGLYHLVPSIAGPILWQSFFLLVPGLIWVLVVREYCRVKRLRFSPALAVIVFLGFWFHPTVSHQVQWSYIFHIAAVSALAAAYLFFLQERWIYWCVALVVMIFEKDEFALIAAAFGVLVLAEGLWERRREKAAFGGVALVISVLSLLPLVGPGREVSFFSDRWGYLGHTPWEVILGFFRNPWPFFEAIFFRSGPLEYLLLFVLVNGVWLAPAGHSFGF